MLFFGNGDIIILIKNTKGVKMPKNLHFEIINDGNALRVSAENPEEFKQFIQDHEDDALTSFTPNSNQAFMELTESYSNTGWGIVTADRLGQLSECLVIAEEILLEDDGSYTLYGRSWTNIDDYQIVNPLDQILENGYYDFQLWANFESAENFKVENQDEIRTDDEMHCPDCLHDYSECTCE